MPITPVTLKVPFSMRSAAELVPDVDAPEGDLENLDGGALPELPEGDRALLQVERQRRCDLRGPSLAGL
jgi:hypothetical protein